MSHVVLSRLTAMEEARKHSIPLTIEGRAGGIDFTTFGEDHVVLSTVMKPSKDGKLPSGLLGTKHTIPACCVARYRAGVALPHDFIDIDGKITKLSIQIFFGLETLIASGRELGKFCLGKLAIVLIDSETYSGKIGLHLFPYLHLGKDKSPEEFSITIRGKEGSDPIDFSLPGMLNANLLKLLTEGREDGEAFTCFQFVIYLCGGQERFRDLEKYAPASEDEVELGSIVLFAKAKTPVHAAVALGEGLYLSMFGRNGLFVAPKEELLRMYPSDAIAYQKIPEEAE